MNKKVFIILGIFFAFIIVTVLVLNVNNDLKDKGNGNNYGENNNGNIDDNNYELNNEYNTELVLNHTHLYIVENLLNDFFINMNLNQNDLINYLHPSYISENNITSLNLNDYLNIYKGDCSIFLTSIDARYLSEDIVMYFVKSDIVENDINNISYNIKASINYVVILDQNNFTYSIIQTLSEDINSAVNQFDRLPYKENIEYNGYNKYKIVSNDNKYLANYYFQNFKYQYLYKKNNKLIDTDLDFVFDQFSQIEKYIVVDDEKEIFIVDNKNQKLTFKIKDVLNYNVQVEKVK